MLIFDEPVLIFYVQFVDTLKLMYVFGYSHIEVSHIEGYDLNDKARAQYYFLLTHFHVFRFPISILILTSMLQIEQSSYYSDAFNSVNLMPGSFIHRLPYTHNSSAVGKIQNKT